MRSNNKLHYASLVKNLLIPYKKKVIFVDWFGVLTQKRFWEKYLLGSGHRYHNKAKKLAEKIFQDDHLLQNWMIGKVSYETILDNCFQTESETDRLIFKNDLLGYCNDIVFEGDLFASLKLSTPNAFIVLATDNMDNFLLSLENLSQIHLFDSILASNMLGVLKKENSKRFFGDWLVSHNLNFENALLIDDTKANCEAFEKCGGKSIHYCGDDSIMHEVLDWVNN